MVPQRVMFSQNMTFPAATASDFAHFLNTTALYNH